jgi:hypothetical protein
VADANRAARIPRRLRRIEKEFGVNKKRRLVRIKHRKSRLRLKLRVRERRLAAKKG